MSNNFTFNIAEWQFSIEDLGASMNEQFQKLYNYYFSGKGFERSGFHSESLNFFDKNNSSKDLHRYFNNFTPLWQFLLQQGSFFYAEQVWEIAVGTSKKWEEQNQNKKIYKGAGYYFWAITCILKEDLEKSFLLMHQALEEDRKNVNSSYIQRRTTPAYSFVILDYEQQNQLFRKKVLEMAEFVEQRLNNYQTLRNGKLTMAEFKVKFLQNSGLIEQVFLFVFELFHVKKLLSENRQGLTQNVYGSMLMIQLISTFSLLIDNIIKYKYSNNQDPYKQQFIDLLIFLSAKANLKLDKSKLQEINKMYKRNFNSTLDDLINSRPVLKAKLQAIEEDIAISYGFRNSAAHKIRNRPYIHGNFNKIVDRLLNVFFLAVEKLY
jgi:hypothetical protein